MTYASLANIIRNGGFGILLAMRLSALPGHIITAVCATVGVGFVLFVSTATLSLPKYLSVVYFGVAIRSHEDKNNNSGSRVVQIVVIIVITVITLLIAWCTCVTANRHLVQDGPSPAGSTRRTPSRPVRPADCSGQAARFPVDGRDE